MNEPAPASSEPNWLESLAAEFLDGQATFDFPLGDGVDPFAVDDPLLPPLTFPTSSDESTPGQRVSAPESGPRWVRRCQTEQVSKCRRVPHPSRPTAAVAVYTPLRAQPFAACTAWAAPFALCTKHVVLQAKSKAATSDAITAPQASPGDPAFASDALLQPGIANGFGLVPMPAAQGDGTHLLPVQGYTPVASQQQPHQPPSLQQTSMGAASVSTSERWAGYDASGSSGAHRTGSNGSAGAPMPTVSAACLIMTWLSRSSGGLELPRRCTFPH